MRPLIGWKPCFYNCIENMEKFTPLYTPWSHKPSWTVRKNLRFDNENRPKLQRYYRGDGKLFNANNKVLRTNITPVLAYYRKIYGFSKM